MNYALHSNFFFFYAPATTEIYTLSLHDALPIFGGRRHGHREQRDRLALPHRSQRDDPQLRADGERLLSDARFGQERRRPQDRKSTRLNSSHTVISYAVFCLKKKKLEIDSDSAVR